MNSEQIEKICELLNEHCQYRDTVLEYYDVLFWKISDFKEDGRLKNGSDCCAIHYPDGKTRNIYKYSPVLCQECSVVLKFCKLFQILKN